MREYFRVLGFMAMACCCSWTSAAALVSGAPPTVPTSRVIDQPNAILNALKQNDFLELLEQLAPRGSLPQMADAWNGDAKKFRERKLKRNESIPLADSANAEIDGDAVRLASPNSEIVSAAALPTEREKLATAQDAIQTQHDGILRNHLEPFNQVWMQLQTDAGVDALVESWQPLLAAAAAERIQDFNQSFSDELIELARDPDMTASDVEQLTRLMYAAQSWAARVDFADRERLRRAVEALARLARVFHLESFEDFRGLPFEDLIAQGDQALRTVKQILSSYDIDADAILHSVVLSEVDAHGDFAILRVQMRVFGVDLSHDFRQRFYLGSWADEKDVNEIEQAKLQGPLIDGELSPLGDPASPVEPRAGTPDVQDGVAPDAAIDSSDSCTPEK